MKKYFVRFLSPGTFVAEETVKEIAGWDVDTAIAMSREIIERHASKPFGFQFFTKERGADDFEPRITEKSCTYYLGGKIRTFAEVMADNLDSEKILRQNMEINGYKRVVENKNSWKYTAPLNDDDVVLDYEV